MARPPFSSVDQLLEALDGLDHQASDDVVAALPHLLQTADLLRGSRELDPELVVAGLVHDIASALDEREGDHGTVGAYLVRPLLGARVADLVAGHTDAKRYLVTVEPSYARGLSANSTATLVGQGGTMTEAEVARFEAGAHADALIALRRADDAAKDPERASPRVESWRPVVEQVAARARS